MDGFLLQTQQGKVSCSECSRRMDDFIVLYQWFSKEGDFASSDRSQVVIWERATMTLSILVSKYPLLRGNLSPPSNHQGQKVDKPKGEHIFLSKSHCKLGTFQKQILFNFTYFVANYKCYSFMTIYILGYVCQYKMYHGRLFIFSEVK